MVDDGIATGATMRAALRATRSKAPKQLILAVPVAPAESLAELRPETDQIICLEEPLLFAAIGDYYDDFRQISDAEVIRIAGAGSPRFCRLIDLILSLFELDQLPPAEAGVGFKL